MDLPAPWEAIDALKLCFDSDMIGRVCCFSPCVEQVQLTVKKLNAEGFFDIQMYEVLQKSHDVKKVSTGKWFKEEQKLKVRLNLENAEVVAANGETDTKKRAADETVEEIEIQTSSGATKENGSALNADGVVMEEIIETATSIIQEIKSIEQFTVSRSASEMRGHTSYLTFAKYVSSIIEH